MDKENLNTGTPEQDEDAILPEGYENENIFDEPAGDDENIFGKEDTIEGFGGDDNGEEDPAPESQPEAEKPEEENGVGAEVGSSAPADVQEQDNEGFRFQNNGTEVTVKEADLPELYRKAQEHGSLSSQLAQARGELEEVGSMVKSMGFESVRQMMDKMAENYRESEVRRLVDSGAATEEVARFIVESKMKQAGAQPVQQPAQQVQQQPTQRRDFRQELTELVQLHPELRESLANGGKLPQEVVAACVKSGISLRAAYAEYEAKEARANAERVQQENDILKQNEKNAARAPVKSVTAGGGTTPKGKDPFLVGFESDI